MNEVTAVLLIDYDYYKSKIIEMFVKSSKILSISYDEIMSRTDYCFKDQRNNRISNAFAEVRATIVLDILGFENISLLKSKKNDKNVDIVCIRNGKKYVVDVTQFTDGFNKDKSIKFNDKLRFKYYIENKYKGKKEQI